ncbi:MAG: hypothetical protein IJ360_02130 [Clostridia bacterium]|nr:hypothetical protein [Clostridia bacterium]
MSKKNPPKNTNEAEYYKINTKAIDRLVNAEKITPPNDKKLKDPAKQYRSDFLDRIPAPVKALFLKFWFNGAVCYFIFWGLGLNISSTLDMIFVLAVALGIITDIFLNNIIRFIETIPGENEKWLMFPKKRFWTFFANILYAFVVLFCVIQTYEFIAIFYVEPILFGLFYMGFDLLFVGMKNLFFTIIEDAKNKVNKQ